MMDQPSTMDPVAALELSALSHLRSINAETHDSCIQMAYESQRVLLTGSSGFLGKHLLEKLLRSTNVKMVYLLLRPKRGKEVQERLGDILVDPVFDSLRKLKPDFQERITAVSGDITQLRLGLANDDWSTLAGQVNFIFHVAATTRFDEPLPLATVTNVRGTREVILLAKECIQLRALVHVSTAFSFATVNRISQSVKEEVYSVPVAPKDLIELAEKEGDGMTRFTDEYTKDWPNTYSFTKAVAEDLVRTMADGLPVSIVRPAVVIGSYREPGPGWVDIQSCAYGPGGMMLGIGLGLIHTVLAGYDTRTDMVPVDLVNNTAIAAGWATATRRDTHTQRDSTQTPIYTVTNNRNPISFGVCGDFMRKECRTQIPSPKAVWYCFGTITTNRLLFDLLFWLLHYIPAYFLDGICFLLGKPRKLVKVYRKAYKLFTTNSYYTTNDWAFGDRNVQSLFKSMSDTDRIMFNCDMGCVDWKECIIIFLLGLRKFVIKDGLTGTDYAKKKQFWLGIANVIVLALYAYLWWKLISFVFSGVMYFL